MENDQDHSDDDPVSTRVARRRPWRGAPDNATIWRCIPRIGLALTLAMVATLLPATAVSSQTAAAWAVDLVTLGPDPQASGAPVGFRLSLQCSAVSAPTCADGEVTIPLPSAVDPDLVEVDPHPYVVSAGVVDDELRIQLPSSFPAGSTLQLDLRAGTRNGTTPDGYVLVLDASVSAANAATASASASAVINAEAELQVTKMLPGNVEPGSVLPLDQPLRYHLKVCDPGGSSSTPGRLYLESGELVDSLPAGAVLVDSSPGGVHDPGANTVTWPLSDLPDVGCPPSTPSTSQYWVDVSYSSEDFSPGDEVTNHATVSGLPYGADEPVTATASVEHGFGTVTAAGVFCKRRHTPYAHFFSLSCSNATVARTYAGRWQPELESAPSPGTSEASFTLETRNTAAVTSIADTTDPLPCLDNPVGAPVRFQSNAPGDLCANPAFVLTSVTSTDPDAASTWVYATPDGEERSFVALTGRLVPQPGDVVAEVRLRDRSVAPGATVATTLHGHVHPDVAVGEQIHNVSHHTLTLGASSVSGTQHGTIEVFDDVYLAVSKGAVAGEDFVIHGGVSRPTSDASGWAGGLVLADLLPVGIPEVTLESVMHRTPSLIGVGPGVPLDPSAYSFEQIQDHNGTGRTLVRLTVAPGAVELAMAGNAVAATFRVPGGFPPGTRVNQARSYLPDGAPVGALTNCFSNSTLVGNTWSRVHPGPFFTDDTDDWNGNGQTSDDPHCRATQNLVNNTAGPLLRATKSVRGDQDTHFASFPAVASTDPEAAGDSEYRVTVRNDGNVAVSDVVAYDVLPVPGDTGVSGPQATTPRGSAFRPSLTGPVVAPAGWTVQYSTAATPCREEVGTGADPWPAGCVDDWDAAPPAELADVTALRFSLDAGQLAGGAGVEFTWPMSTPTSAEPGDVAWNTVAVVGTRVDDGTTLLPAEAPKVGLAVPLTDVSLTKDVDRGAVAVGEEVEFTVVAAHDTRIEVGPGGSVDYVGPDGEPTGAVAPATGLEVTDVLPAGLELVPGSIVAQRGSFDPDTGVWTVGTLQVGETAQLRYRATVVAPGEHTNRAQVSALGVADVDSEPGDCPAVVDDDCDEATVVTLSSGISLEKLVESAPGTDEFITADPSVGPPGVHPSGGLVRYRFVVHNVGGTTLDDVMITDPLLPLFCDEQFGIGTLGPDEQVTVDCEWPLGWPVGSTVNTATVSGTPPAGPPVTASDDAEVVVPTPAITVEKSTNGVDADLPGDAVELEPGADVTWQYVLTNTGNDALVDLSLVDDQEPQVELRADACVRSSGSWASPLAPGATITCEFTGEAAIGLYSNTATVQGRGAITPLTVTDADPSHYVVPTPGPSVDVVKSTNGVDGADPATRPTLVEGAPVTWQYVVVNTGGEPLEAIELVDDQEADVELSPAACERSDGANWAAPLLPGGTITCQHQGAVVLGGYVNVATVTAVGSETDTPVDADDESGYEGVPPVPAIEVVKTTNGQGHAGQVEPGIGVVWSYVITNTGTEPLVDLALGDDREPQVGLDPAHCLRDDDADWGSALPVGARIACSFSGVASDEVYDNVAIVLGAGEQSSDTAGAADESGYRTVPEGEPAEGPAGDPADDPMEGPVPGGAASGPDPSADGAGVGRRAGPPPGALAFTGLDGLMLALAGLGVLVGGLALRGPGRRRSTCVAPEQE